MIGKLRGLLDGTTPEGYILVDVSGVGYCVRMPAQVDILLQLGQEVMLFIHTAVREDAIDLYGFLTEEELQFFKQLMQVSGVGPKTALGIMNVADVSSLKRAIAAGDSAQLTNVFGIGKKSAERLIVELRDKIKLQASKQGVVYTGEDDSEVIEALMALGYRADEGRKALKDVPASTKGTHARLSAALRQLGGGAKVS
jgi:Holliday junction DNA helicase RuvA